MRPGLIQAYSSQIFHREGHRLLDILADHLKRSTSNQPFSTINYKSPVGQRAYWREKFSEPLMNTSQAFLKEVLSLSPNIRSSGCMVTLMNPFTWISDLRLLMKKVPSSSQSSAFLMRI
jgi:hypothetical protein